MLDDRVFRFSKRFECLETLQNSENTHASVQREDELVWEIGAESMSCA